MPVERDQIRTLLIALGIVCAFVGAVWYPMHRKQNVLHDQIATLDEAIRANRAATVGLTATGQKIVELQNTIKSSEKFVPKEPDLASLLRLWTTQLKEYQVKDEEIQTQPVVRGDDFSLIPIKLKFGGSFASVFSFLQYVEGMNRLSRFTELQVEGNPDQPEQPLVVRVELSTFYAPGPGGDQ